MEGDGNGGENFEGWGDRHVGGSVTFDGKFIRPGNIFGAVHNKFRSGFCEIIDKTGGVVLDDSAKI